MTIQLLLISSLVSRHLCLEILRVLRAFEVKTVTAKARRARRISTKMHSQHNPYHLRHHPSPNLHPSFLNSAFRTFGQQKKQAATLPNARLRIQPPMWPIGSIIRPLHAAENEIRHCITQQAPVQQQRSEGPSLHRHYPASAVL